MTRDELRLAITGPAGVGGARVSPRLVSRLLNDVEDDQDQLPVLQHALRRVWSRWEDERKDEASLDLEHYEAVGTMREALSRHAQETFDELRTERDRVIAERLFKALTDTDRDGRGVRRPVTVREICAVADAEEREVARVVDRFRLPGRSFLMPPAAVPLGADTVVDMSHESLMRNWATLERWAAEEAESAAVYRRLSEAAARERAGEGGLWRSPELDIGLRWRETNAPTAAWARRYDPAFEQAMAFLEKSRQARDEETARRKEEARQREDARRRQLRLARLLALSVTVIFALATLLLGYFYVHTRRAEQQARLQAVLSARDPLVRTLLLGELEDAAGLDQGLEVAQQVASAAIPRAVLRARDEGWLGVGFSADDAEVATVSTQGAVAWWRSDGRGRPRPGVTIPAPTAGSWRRDSRTALWWSSRAARTRERAWSSPPATRNTGGRCGPWPGAATDGGSPSATKTTGWRRGTPMAAAAASWEPTGPDTRRPCPESRSRRAAREWRARRWTARRGSGTCAGEGPRRSCTGGRAPC
jgi:hypothetical protein